MRTEDLDEALSSLEEGDGVDALVGDRDVLEGLGWWDDEWDDS